MVWNAVPTFTVGQKLTAALENFMKGNFDVLGGPMSAYTPTWGSTGTAPAIGNGTVTGGAVLANKIVDFRIAVAFGSSTTFGTGTYSLTLPSTPIAGVRYSFDGWIFQGSSLYKIHGHANGSSTAQLYYINAVGGAAITAVSGTGPVTLTAAAGNGIYLNGRYEAA